jgi:hypothetical protein
MSSLSQQDRKRFDQMYGFIETPTPTVCEFCRQRQVKTMTSLHFGRKTMTLHTCAVCNIKLKEQQEAFEADKKQKRAEAAAKRKGK